MCFVVSASWVFFEVVVVGVWHLWVVCVMVVEFAVWVGYCLFVSVACCRVGFDTAEFGLLWVFYVGIVLVVGLGICYLCLFCVAWACLLWFVLCLFAICLLLFGFLVALIVSFDDCADLLCGCCGYIVCWCFDFVFDLVGVGCWIDCVCFVCCFGVFVTWWVLN